MLNLPEVGSSRGAPMGRRETHFCPDPMASFDMRIERILLEDGDYDLGGAYWGGPENLFQVTAKVAAGAGRDGIHIEMYVRADSLKEAMEGVALCYPNARIAEPLLNDFVYGYIRAALGTESEQLQEGADQSTPLVAVDIDQATLEEMARDCKCFQDEHQEALGQIYARFGDTPYRAGMDFWLTRNGHGTGFWDRGYGLIGEKLTTAAAKVGSVDLILGDNGKIYQVGGNKD